MTSARSRKKTEQAEIDSLDLHPNDEAKRRTDDLLRRMLGTPPKPHAAKPARKKAKRAK
jgi:hypothetical protein